ncbi:phage protein Gp36 family protein [Anatilimnocola sp. NA78]|uniref:phage protein Gp36 family protein n=1 Tax=Anatilimnocola sp. NA78 TaxID=3415683 RepID=UPI003CE57FDC
MTYCTTADLEAIWAPDLLLASVDDDESGTLSPAEEAHLQRAIERAAGRMNAILEVRYSLASLAGNAWCRDANAAIAVYLLAIRRGEQAPQALQEQHDTYFAELLEIAAGRRNIPQAVITLDTRPSVTNFRVDFSQARAVRRD